MVYLNKQQELIQRTINEFAEKELAPKAAYWDQKEEVPLENVKKVAKQGLLGWRIPKEYGGQGADLMSECIAWEEIARACANTTLLLLVQDFVAGILMHASEGLKRKYIPQLCSGDKLFSSGVQPPEGGSDLDSMSVGAKKEKDNYILNLEKTWVSFATVADLFMVLTKTEKGYSAFLVEKGTPGLKLARLNRFIGNRAIGNSTVYFRDCVIPEENIIGKEGEGLDIISKEAGPALLLIAMQNIGIARAAFESALESIKERKLYGKPIAKLQGVRWTIAEMAVEIEAARQLIFHGAALYAAGSPEVAKLASMAKWYATEMSVKVAKEAMQLYGAYGMIRENPAERYWRDAMVMTIGEFATDYHKSAVADYILG